MTLCHSSPQTMGPFSSPRVSEVSPQLALAAHQARGSQSRQQLVGDVAKPPSVSQLLSLHAPGPLSFPGTVSLCGQDQESNNLLFYKEP